MSFALPVARAILPFIGRAAASGAVGLGASSLLGKIFGGKRKRRKRYRQKPRKNTYIRGASAMRDEKTAFC